ncbi:MAG: phage holin family protein [Elainellaceae cyanobacterium]
MVGNLLVWLATALSLMVVDIVVPGVRLETLPAILIATASIGLVNAFVKPVISTLSLPLTFLSFGLFSLVVNGLCFWLASVLVPGFAVRGILAFILGPIVLSLVNSFLNKYFAEKYPALETRNKTDMPSET